MLKPKQIFLLEIEEKKQSCLLTWKLGKGGMFLMGALVALWRSFHHTIYHNGCANSYLKNGGLPLVAWDLERL